MAAIDTLPGLNLPPWSLTPPRPIVGIDPSTQRMSLAVLLPVADRRWYGPIGPVPFTVDTLSLPRAKGARRWFEAQRAIVPWLGELIDSWQPELVVVEQPFAHGRHVPPVSYYVIGVLLAALGAYRQNVVMMSPGEWKKLALGQGHGNAKPADYLRWARAAGYSGALEDEAAAIGVATAGGVMLAARKSSQAAALDAGF